MENLDMFAFFTDEQDAKIWKAVMGRDYELLAKELGEIHGYSVQMKKNLPLKPRYECESDYFNHYGHERYE
jgi:hypothetical protein